MPRPSFQAAEQQRKLVRSLAALGLPQQQMAASIGLRSPKTLRKHFRAELKAGLAEATLAVARVAWDMAVSGRYPQMTIFWDKCHRPMSEEPEEKKEKRPRTRSARSGFIFIDTKKARDAA